MAAGVKVLRKTLFQSFSNEFSKLSHIRARQYVSNTKVDIREQPRKNNDDVYLLNYRAPPVHTLTDALNVLRAYAISDMNETLELHLKLNMGEKKNRLDAFRGIVLLPKPYGNMKKVMVFAEGEMAEAAWQVGADIVGGEELFQQVTDGTVNFDHCLASLNMLEKMKHLQKILRQKMPNTRRVNLHRLLEKAGDTFSLDGTATDNLVEAIRRYKQGHPYRCDKHGYMNAGVGKLSFSDADLKTNCQALIQAANSHRITSKGKFIQRVILSSTRGPGLKLQLSELIS